MSEREPTRDQLLAMAYADGELDDAATKEFEARLSTDQNLLREVAELKLLGVLARQVAPKEPKDFEWEALENEALHGGGLTLGLFASAAGAIGAILWMFYALLSSDLPIAPKVFLALLLGGLAAVFLLILRARIRMAPNDPYTEVQR